MITLHDMLEAIQIANHIQLASILLNCLFRHSIRITFGDCCKWPLKKA